MDTVLLLSFLTYFAILLTVGYAAYCWQRRQMVRIGADPANFMVGNRSLNFWVTALSANASDTSSWLFMGFPVLIYLHGLTQIWVAVALIIGMLLNWQLVAPRLRSESERLGACTVASFFERRFKDTSGTLRLLTAGITFFFFAIYISAMLLAMGKMFESYFSLPYALGILLGICSVALYTTIGGFVAVAWTDSFQALFMLGSIIVVPIAAVWCGGYGMHDVLVGASVRGIPLHVLGDCSPTSLANVILLMLGWGLGYFGMPHIQSKFMGIDDVANLRKSKYVSLVWQTIAYCAATAVGLLGCAFFANGLIDGDLLFINMVHELFAPFTGGLILCGLFAATVSTIDSMVLVVASVITEDIYRPLYNKFASTNELKFVFRLSVISACLLGAIIALARFSSVNDLVWYAWTGLGCSFGPLMLMSLYVPWVTKRGAIAGILVGAVAAGMWQPLSYYLSNYIPGGLEIPGMVVGFAASFVAIWCVSRCSPR